jgi:hypothetical protein
MRNIIFWVGIAAAALMQVGIAEWANSHERALEAQALTQIENPDTPSRRGPPIFAVTYAPGQREPLQV